MKTNIRLLFTPLSVRKCVYQFIRTGIEDVGEPVVMSQEMYDYLEYHDQVFSELLRKGKPFSMYFVTEEGKTE